MKKLVNVYFVIFDEGTESQDVIGPLRTRREARKRQLQVEVRYYESSQVVQFKRVVKVKKGK